MNAQIRPRRMIAAAAQRGFSLIEMLLVTAAMATLMVVLSYVISSFGQQAKYQMAAQQLLQVQTAAEQFVKTNFTQLLDPAATGNIAAIGNTRIITVADVVEAIDLYRPYRPGLGIDAALGEISTHRGRFYDERIVDCCLSLFREQGFGFAETTDPDIWRVKS